MASSHRGVYQFGQSKLILEFGDITTSQAQVLVSSDDSYLSMGGGVSAALRRAGGNAITIDAAKKVPAALGEVVVTTAGTLPAQYIFHAITIGNFRPSLSAEEILRNTTRRCMQMLEALQLSSIAFPAIGAGAAGFPYEEVAAQMAEVISDALLKRSAPAQVTIYLFDRYGNMSDLDYISFFEQFAARAPRISSHQVDSNAARQELVATHAKEKPPATPKEIRVKRLHHLRKLMANLEDQRYQLEETLIRHEGNADEIRKKLAENEELRLKYLAEWNVLSEQKDDAEESPRSKDWGLTVFVSSTAKDLAAHREAILKEIVKRDLRFRGMEFFGANPDGLRPAKLIVEEVRKADVYLGVFGARYGSLDPATGLSMTELEFREAEKNSMRMLLYVMKDDAPVSFSDVESDPQSRVKLDSLRAYILKTYMVFRFSTAEDLAQQVYIDLGKL